MEPESLQANPKLITDSTYSPDSPDSKSQVILIRLAFLRLGKCDRQMPSTPEASTHCNAPASLNKMAKALYTIDKRPPTLANGRGGQNDPTHALIPSSAHFATSPVALNRHKSRSHHPVVRAYRPKSWGNLKRLPPSTVILRIL